MARYSRIDRRMWGDDAFRRLSKPQPNAQSLFVYLLTGPHVENIPGVFSTGEAGLAEALGWPLKAFRKTFLELSRKPLVKADWNARFVFIPNTIRYNPPANPNVVKSWRATWDELPECPLKSEAKQHLGAFLKDMGEAFAKAFQEAIGNPLAKPLPNQDQEQDQKQESPQPPKGAMVDRAERLSPEEIQRQWNAIPGVKVCKALGGTIRDRVRTRTKEHPDQRWWGSLFQQVHASDFLCGRTNGAKGSFHASLEWILRPTNLDKILAGDYDPISSNGHGRTCTKRVQRPGDEFSRPCGQPAISESRSSEPRCADHFRESNPNQVTHANQRSSQTTAQ